MVTIKDIASMANVSRGTVDRVLNNRGGVSPRTAERIRLIAEKMNYTPSITGRGLAVMKKDLKFGFILPAELNGHTSLNRALVQKTEEFAEYSITVLRRAYADRNVQELLKAIDELEAEGVAGIAMSPIPQPEVGRRINELSQRGIVVVTYEYDLPESQRLAFVGCDYYRNGQTIAGVVRLTLGGRGTVGIVTGALSAMAHERRLRGFVDRLTENCPGIRLVAQAVCDEDDVSTYTAVKKILLENPELDLLVVNVASAFGSMRAVKEHPKPLHVISTNRVSEMEKYLEEHAVDAMVTHQPWVLADLSLDILFQYLVWGKKPKEEALFTNNEIVIPENMRFRPLPL